MDEAELLVLQVNETKKKTYVKPQVSFTNSVPIYS